MTTNGPAEETQETARPTMPFRRILLWTFGIALGVALGGVVVRHGDFSLGVGVGALLACAGLFHIKYALRKSLTDPSVTTPAPFLIASVIRWLAWAVVLYFLLKVSLACLLGAAFAYLIYLAVLTYHGLRFPPAVPEGAHGIPYPDEDENGEKP